MRLEQPSRRDVFCMLAGAGVAGAGTRNAIYNPELVVDTAVWVRLAESRRLPVAGIVDEAMVGIQRAGYGRLDLAADFLRSDARERTVTALSRLRLEPAIVTIEGGIDSPAAADRTCADVLDMARKMPAGVRFAGFRPAESVAGKSIERLDFEAYQLNRIGQQLQHTGTGLILRHGIGAMRENAREWRHFLAHTEPGNVAFSLDLELAVRAGSDPFRLLEAAGPRLRSVYLRNVAHGAPMELLGDGDIDIPAVAERLRQTMYDGFLVVSVEIAAGIERRNSLVAALTRSRWYAHEVFGARPGQLPVEMGPHVRNRK